MPHVKLYGFNFRRLAWMRALAAYKESVTPDSIGEVRFRVVEALYQGRELLDVRQRAVVIAGAPPFVAWASSPCSRFVGPDQQNRAAMAGRGRSSTVKNLLHGLEAHATI